MLLLVLSVLALCENTARIMPDTGSSNSNGQTASSTLPITFKYRGGDIGVDGGGSYASSPPENPLDMYAIVAAASVVIILGTLSAYLLVRWNKRQKLRAILKSFRNQ